MAREAWSWGDGVQRAGRERVDRLQQQLRAERRQPRLELRARLVGSDGVAREQQAAGVEAVVDHHRSDARLASPSAIAHWMGAAPR